MAAPSTHRFLFGRSPDNADRRIWVLSGQIQDWFFHDLLRGCVGLRRCLEQWALDEGLALCVCLDDSGNLDFSGNPDPGQASQMFDGSQPRRPSRLGNVHRRREAPTGTAAPGAEGGDDEPGQAKAAAAQAREAAGGSGQSLLNVVTRLTSFLKQDQVGGLVLVDDLCGLIRRLEHTQGGGATAREVIELVQRQWHAGISTANLLVLPCLTPEDSAWMATVLPRDRFRMVEWIEIEGPAAPEIQAALHRLSWRAGFELEGAGAIAEQLRSTGNLRVALGKVARVVKGGRERVTLESVLGLPPVNERGVAAIVAELNGLEGLAEVKAAVTRLQARARAVRQQLAEGASELPQETLHMVFSGRPGTGKTLVAGIVARLFHALGLLETDRVRETIAAEIFSSNRGETSENMRRLIQECRGGVLFLDEAHQLGDPENPQAVEAVSALVPMAWNLRHQLVIILAGYADRMHGLFKMDPGMDRRFRTDSRIHFPDYGFNELWSILQRELARRGRRLSPQAEPAARTLLRARMSRSSFGNAGGAVNLAAAMLERQADSPAAGSPEVGPEHLPPIIQRRADVLQRAMAELEGRVGLEPVRARLRSLALRLEYDLEELAHGGGARLVQIHPGNMLFTGPPGTGKTTVGRLLGQILFGLGCTDKPICVEAGRATLVGAYQGHSARAVAAVVEEARDGVLFVDEAYSLVQSDQDSFGKEARDELVRQVTLPDNAGTVFVLGGYHDKLLALVQGNPGIARRFPIEIPFPAFTPADCAQLVREALVQAELTWQEGVLERVEALAAEAVAERGDAFGSAGWAQGIVGGALERMKGRVLSARIPVGDPGRTRVLPCDLPELYSGQRAAEPARAPAQAHTWIPDDDARELASSLDGARAVDRNRAAEILQQCSFQVVARRVGADGEANTGLATGFFVTPDGLVATSAHVVEGEPELFVLCGRRRSARRARVVACDPHLDLALLAADVDPGRAYLPLGESLAVPVLSELVVHGNAHVNPGEPGRVVTAHVVRNDPDNALDLETDGAIERGFSGGPALYVAQGAVVAIVKGGYGPSATLLVRSEQLRSLLAQLGYRIPNAQIGPGRVAT
jgi:SpoVK/Ycf46/Vps4 family AAA+-type ATPase